MAVMRREGNKLTALAVSKKKRPGRYSDGHGLWLQISESGTKAWLFRYMINGRARHMGLGPLHTVNLAEARQRARQERQLILDGKDPIEVKYAARAASRSAENMSFKDAAQQFIELYESSWRNARHRQQWRETLRAYAYPVLGGRPVSAIDSALITHTLAPIWTDKPETAKRVKQRIERVIQWVKDGMPLPMQGASKRVQHHPALSFAELPAFMGELRSLEEIRARALEFTILTASRTSEVLKATWDEIDLEAKVWTIPVERMEGNREHRVPLSAEAIQILRSLPHDGLELVFLGSHAGRPMSPDAMQRLITRLRPGLTVHGFRSSFRDWAGDRTSYPRDVIEMALAHAIKDKSEAAYRRGDALDKHRRLMTEWARYCYSPSMGGEVVALHG
jgi:integrase